MSTLRVVMLSGMVALAVPGCAAGTQQPAPVTPTQSTQSAQPDASLEPSDRSADEYACSEDAPATPAQCACLGGTVRSHSGDHDVTCPPGETQLKRLEGDSAGAVCCKALKP